MSCRRAYDLDLAAFLRDPHAPEVGDFVEHYPRCPDCAAEVRAWTEVHLVLGDRHPGPAGLLAYHDGTLAGDARATLGRHLEACRSCAEELRAMRRYDAVTREASPAVALAPGGHRTRHSTLRRLGRVLWHPAFAYAVALLLLAPVVTRRWWEAAPPAGSFSRRAELDLARDADIGGLVGAPPPTHTEAARPVAPPRPGASDHAAQRAAPPPPVATEREAAAKQSPGAPAQAPTFDAEARTLTIPVAESARSAAALEVLLRDAAGARELRQRFAPPRPGEPLLVPLPQGWPTPGAWEVELHAAGAVTRFTLHVP